MTDRFETFDIRFRKALDYWGEGNFPQAFRDQAHERTKDLSREEMDSLCVTLMESCERVPSLVKLLGYASLIRNRRPRLSIVVSQRPCTICQNSGYVVAETQQHGRVYRTSFRCPDVACDLASEKNTPRWAESFKPAYNLEEAK